MGWAKLTPKEENYLREQLDSARLRLGDEDSGHESGDMMDYPSIATSSQAITTRGVLGFARRLVGQYERVNLYEIKFRRVTVYNPKSKDLLTRVFGDFDKQFFTRTGIATPAQ